MASQRFARLTKILAGAVADADDIFQLDGRFERFVHFWAMVTGQFIRHRCFVRASALSYSTLVALIPLLAVALSVTSNLLNPQQEAELSRFVERTVSSVAPAVNIATNAPPAPLSFPDLAATNATAEHTTSHSAPDLLATADLSATNAVGTAAPALTVNTQSQVAGQIHDLVKKTSGGALGSIGLIFLIITAVSLLRGIEETFNDIWGVTRGRNWWLQFMLYWFIITLGPIVLSVGLGLAGSPYLQHTRTLLQSSPWLAPVYAHLLPMAILSVALGLLYKLTPNTKVEFNAAMIGGLCAGAAWHGYNQLGFLLLSRATTASKFYGGLALIVLLMGGLYVLWLIILFGAQMAYAWQNRVAYLQDRLADNVNQRGREFVALRIMTCLGRRFQGGQRPATVPQISTELAVPSRLTQSVLRTLVATQLVSEVAGAEAGFLPARPLEAINAHDILQAMRTGTGQELPLSDTPELTEIYGEFARIEQAERQAAAEVTLWALATRPPAHPALPEPPAPELRKTAEPLVVLPPTGVEPMAPPLSSPSPETIEPAAPKPPRRESVQPDEYRDFPL